MANKNRTLTVNLPVIGEQSAPTSGGITEAEVQVLINASILSKLNNDASNLKSPEFWTKIIGELNTAQIAQLKTLLGVTEVPDLSTKLDKDTKLWTESEKSEIANALASFFVLKTDIEKLLTFEGYKQDGKQLIETEKESLRTELGFNKLDLVEDEAIVLEQSDVDLINRIVNSENLNLIFPKNSRDTTNVWKRGDTMIVQDEYGNNADLSNFKYMNLTLHVKGSGNFQGGGIFVNNSNEWRKIETEIEPIFDIDKVSKDEIPRDNKPIVFRQNFEKLNQNMPNITGAPFDYGFYVYDLGLIFRIDFATSKLFLDDTHLFAQDRGSSTGTVINNDENDIEIEIESINFYKANFIIVEKGTKNGAIDTSSLMNKTGDNAVLPIELDESYIPKFLVGTYIDGKLNRFSFVNLQNIIDLKAERDLSNILASDGSKLVDGDYVLKSTSGNTNISPANFANKSLSNIVPEDASLNDKVLGVIYSYDNNSSSLVEVTKFQDFANLDAKFNKHATSYASEITSLADSIDLKLNKDGSDANLTDGLYGLKSDGTTTKWEKITLSSSSDELLTPLVKEIPDGSSISLGVDASNKEEALRSININLNNVESTFKTVFSTLTQTGILTNLTTTNKSNLVEAINEALSIAQANGNTLSAPEEAVVISLITTATENLKTRLSNLEIKNEDLEKIVQSLKLFTNIDNAEENKYLKVISTGNVDEPYKISFVDLPNSSLSSEEFETLVNTTLIPNLANDLVNKTIVDAINYNSYMQNLLLSSIAHTSLTTTGTNAVKSVTQTSISDDGTANYDIVNLTQDKYLIDVDSAGLSKWSSFSDSILDFYKSKNIIYGNFKSWTQNPRFNTEDMEIYLNTNFAFFMSGSGTYWDDNGYKLIDKDGVESSVSGKVLQALLLYQSNKPIKIKLSILNYNQNMIDFRGESISPISQGVDDKIIFDIRVFSSINSPVIEFKDLYRFASGIKLPISTNNYDGITWGKRTYNEADMDKDGYVVNNGSFANKFYMSLSWNWKQNSTISDSSFNNAIDNTRIATLENTVSTSILNLKNNLDLKIKGLLLLDAWDGSKVSSTKFYQNSTTLINDIYSNPSTNVIYGALKSDLTGIIAPSITQFSSIPSLSNGDVFLIQAYNSSATGNNLVDEIDGQKVYAMVVVNSKADATLTFTDKFVRLIYTTEKSIGGGSSRLSTLADVRITSPQTNQILKWDGANWINDNQTSTGGASLQPWTLINTTGRFILSNNTFANGMLSVPLLTNITWKASMKTKIVVVANGMTTTFDNFNAGVSTISLNPIRVKQGNSPDSYYDIHIQGAFMNNSVEHMGFEVTAMKTNFDGNWGFVEGNLPFNVQMFVYQKAEDNA